MAKYKCKICNATFDADEGKEPICPICGATGSNLVKIG